MVAAQFAAMEWSLEAAMRALSERGELCRQMAEESRNPALSAQWTDAMNEAKDRTGAMRDLLENRWTHPGDSGRLAPSGG